MLSFGEESFAFLFATKSVQIKIYRTVILPSFLYGCETLSLTLRERYRLRVFENTVLRRIFGPKRYEITGERRSLQNKDLNVLYSSLIILGYKIEKNVRGGACSTCGGEEVHAGFWLGNLRERDHLEEPGVDGNII